MAASLIRRIGTPRALAKLKPIHPLPKCRIFYDASLAYGRGETDRRHVESPPACALFKLCDQLFGSHARPGCKYALIAKRHEQFYACAADIGDQNFSLHGRPASSGVLAVASRLFSKTLEDALLFWFGRRAGWPAFHYLKSDKAEEHLPCRFQIES